MLKIHFVGWFAILILGAARAAAQDNPYQKPIDRASLKRIQNKWIDPEVKLNAAVKKVRSLQGDGVAVTDVPLDTMLLYRLNVRRGEKGVESGFLRQGKHFPWPATLRECVSAEARDEFWTRLQPIVKEGKAKVRPEATRELRQAAERLGADLRQKINDIPPSQYLDCKRFLVRIDMTVKALDNPAWRADLSAARALPMHGKSVTALVRYLGEKGLEIAAPMPGDEDVNREVGRAVTRVLESARPR